MSLNKVFFLVEMTAFDTEALTTDSAICLNQASVGCELRVESVSGPQCQQLREVGFCENMRVRLLKNSRRSLVCELCGTRMALSQDLAEQVRVLSHSN